MSNIRRNIIRSIVMLLTIWSYNSLTMANSTNFEKDSLQIDKYLKEVEKKLNSKSNVSKSDFESMLHSLDNAKQESASINSLVLDYRINALFAKVYSKSNNASIALDYSFQNMNMLEPVYKNRKDTLIEHCLFETYLTIGNNYMYYEDFTKSEIYYKKIIQLLENGLMQKYPDRYGNRVIVFYNNFAAMYTAKNDNKSAKIYYDKVLQLTDIVKDEKLKKSYKASIYNNLGIVSQRSGKKEDAFRYYNQALKLWQEINDTVSLAKVYNNLGDYYYRLGQKKEALECLKLAFDYGHHSKNRKSEMLASQNLSEVYLSESDYKSALYYSSISRSLKDSMMSNDKIRSITELELKYKYEKQKKEEQILQQINKEREQRQVIIFASIVVVLILILIVFVLLYRNQQIKNNEMALQEENLKLEKDNLELEKMQLQSDIEFKNKELTTNVMYLLNKNELISSISEKLLTLKLDKDSEQSKILKSIVSELKQNIDNNAWSEFEVRFQNVHQDFHDKLNERFPELTPNEIKLCSFLKLNMSTKDISSVTLQSTKSIEVARTRLRKKLGLERDENLILFLQKL